MKALLLTFDRNQIARSEVTKALDRMPEVADWYAFFGNTVCLLTEAGVRTTAELIRNAFPELRFIVTEIDRNRRGGWLPRAVWSFMDKASGAETSAV